VTKFHPFKNLPELVQELVYQGSVGRELLQQDAELLDITFASTEQILHNLAEKQGLMWLCNKPCRLSKMAILKQSKWQTS